MKHEHHRIFHAAADRFQCWIGLREPNPLADRWIGKPGYMPKAMSVKAKTADRPGHPLAGLVVDPTLRPGAFRAGDSLKRAKDNWKPSALPEGAQVTQEGDEKGLVRVHGKAIYADYDLMCLIQADEKGGMAFTTGEQGMSIFQRVALFINTRIGVPMIQHGPEFDPSFAGVGAKETERVYYYGPGGQTRMSMSSMPPRDRAH